MRTDVIMPQMGESVAEGTVTRWLKQVGDFVEADETLFEISTDKVEAEIPSPAAGYIIQILVQEEETVEINTVVAVLSSEKDDVGDAPAAPPAKEEPERTPEPPAPASTPAAPSIPPAAPARPSMRPSTGGPSVDAIEAALRARRDEGDIPSALELRKVRSSPVVRKIAKEHGISIMDVEGTGLDGRVTKADILAYLESGPPAAAPGPGPQTSSTAPRSGAPSTLGGDQVSWPHTDVPQGYMWNVGPRDEVVALSNMRKRIAEHMVASKRISAHVNNFLEVDMTRLVRARQAKKAEFLERTGLKLTYMPFIMYATCQALAEFPEINASIVGDDVVIHKDVNLGVAVALDWGLIVPVVKNAGEKNILGLSRNLTDLATRARAKKLSVDEVAGCTFSITNPGSFGSMIGTPIIPQPNVAILSVGAITKRPWVLEGPEGDSIAIRHIMMTSLSFDHRLVDGAEAAKFMVRIKEILEGFDVESI